MKRLNEKQSAYLMMYIIIISSNTACIHFLHQRSYVLLLFVASQQISESS
jgi:hypothetical protein